MDRPRIMLPKQATATPHSSSAIRVLAAALIIVVLTCVTSCSSDEGDGKGRFVIDRQSSSATPSTGVSQVTQTPQSTPSTVLSSSQSPGSALEDVMKQAGEGAPDS